MCQNLTNKHNLLCKEKNDFLTNAAFCKQTQSDLQRKKFNFLTNAPSIFSHKCIHPYFLTNAPSVFSHKCIHPYFLTNAPSVFSHKCTLHIFSQMHPSVFSHKCTLRIFSEIHPPYFLTNTPSVFSHKCTLRIFSQMHPPYFLTNAPSVFSHKCTLHIFSQMHPPYFLTHAPNLFSHKCNGATPSSKTADGAIGQFTLFSRDLKQRVYMVYPYVPEEYEWGTVLRCPLYIQTARHINTPLSLG